MANFSNNNKFEKTKAVLELINEGVTEEKFLDSFRYVVNFVKKTEGDLQKKIILELGESVKKLQAKFNGMEVDYKKSIDNIEKNNKESFLGIRQWGLKQINKVFINRQITKKADEMEKKTKVLDNKIEMLDDKTKVFDSKTKEIGDAIDSIEKDRSIDKEEIISDIEEVKNKIVDETKILKKDFEKIKRNYDKLKKMIKDNKPRFKPIFGGAQPIKLLTETPSGTINGTNKVFTVVGKPEFITVMGQMVYEDNGYALTSVSNVLTVTFDHAPVTGSIIRSHYYQI